MPPSKSRMSDRSTVFPVLSVGASVMQAARRAAPGPQGLGPVRHADQSCDGLLRQHEAARREAYADPSCDIQDLKEVSLLGKREVPIAGAEAVGQVLRRELSGEVLAQIVAHVLDGRAGCRVQDHRVAHVPDLTPPEQKLRLASQCCRHQDHAAAFLQQFGYILSLRLELRPSKASVRLQFKVPPDGMRPGRGQDLLLTAGNVCLQFFRNPAAEVTQILQGLLPVDAGQSRFHFSPHLPAFLFRVHLFSPYAHGANLPDYSTGIPLLSTVAAGFLFPIIFIG